MQEASVVPPSILPSPWGAGLPTSAFRRPGACRVALTGATAATGGVVDLVAGTHWAFIHRRRASRRRRALRLERKALDGFMATHADTTSPAMHREVRLNAAAAVAGLGQIKQRQRLRKHLWGETVGVGGAAMGAGMAATSPGLGSWVPAVTVIHAPLCWVGAPLLSVAAGGMAIFQGARVARTVYVERRLPNYGATSELHPAERDMYSALHCTLKMRRQQAAAKGVSLACLAAGAPVAVAGVFPALALVIPGAIGTTWAVYRNETKLRYVPRLSATARACLGSDRDIANRYAFENGQYRVLKQLKQARRVCFVRGKGSVPVVRELAMVKRAWRLRRAGMQALAPAYPTVWRYLVAQAALDVQFTSTQVLSTTSPCPPALVEVCRDEQDLLARIAQPTAQDAGRHFVHWLYRHDAADAFLAALQASDHGRGLLQRHRLVRRLEGRIHLDGERLLTLVASGGPLDEAARRAFAHELCIRAEDYLLTQQKTRASHGRRELLAHVSHRLTTAKPRARR